MASYENFHESSGYGLNSNYGNFTGYMVKASDISFPTDATTSNQLKKVSDKISSGTKSIEVSGLNLFAATPMKGLAAIPKQHWQEIDRLRKLTGVDLTFHGPLVEPTGVGRGNWSEDQREEAERQMKDAINLAQKIDPKGNVVVTFHSSSSLPEVRRRIKVGTNPDGSPIEKTVQLGVINERTGELGPINLPGKDYLGKEKEVDLDDWLEKKNEEIWTKQLHDIGFENNRARTEIAQAQLVGKIFKKRGTIDDKNQSGLYKLSKTNPVEYQKAIKLMNRSDKLKNNAGDEFNQGFVDNLNDATAFANQAYVGLKNAFNDAYEKAEESNDKKTLNKLNGFREDMATTTEAYFSKKDNLKLIEFQEKINNGIRVLQTLEAPQAFKHLEEFAYDKASETFANTALHGYKKFGQNAPIISIENPPAGMSGLTRGDELKELAKRTREKFVKKAVETGMSQSRAEKQAEKLIGVTWDTGHINSIRKWGYDEADVVADAKKVAPFVKHVHAVDNLGFEDSELPPGMGNVPFDKILKSHPNFQKAKKVIETGEWFSTQGGLGLKKTPISEAFEGFGAPVYSFAGSPYWNQTIESYGSHFSGLGPINPEVHHSTYGAGFTNLPAYQGGEIVGSGNSSFSGAPLE
jgi:sugar phosphate isomerase/epimerase